MNKEQIKDKIKEFINYACEEGVTDDDIYMLMEDVFPQGEGGVLCDDGICKAVCKERTRYCAFALKSIDMPCEWYDQYKRVAQAQHALDNQSKQAALKVQMERVIGKITSRILELSIADYVSGGMAELQALKAELEGENGK